MQLAMVIDLQRCVGCGACALGCKAENNTQGRSRGQTFNWHDFVYIENGTFPNVSYTALPVRCNHCSEPECIKGCPKPQSLYKSEEGLTLYNVKYCIQCKKCQEKCPYSAVDVDKQHAEYSVISFNQQGVKPNQFYDDRTEAIKGCTASGAEVAKVVGTVPPNRHAFNYKDNKKPRDPKVTRGQGEARDVRSAGWIEKCTFCVQRIRNKQLPACVDVCPAKARYVGDIHDPASEVSQLLKKYKPMRLKNNKGEFLKDSEKGTQPNMYYIRNYNRKA